MARELHSSTIPMAHEDSQASMECAEYGLHMSCVGYLLLLPAPGLTQCGCWCHVVRRHKAMDILPNIGEH